jgi:hypothetical protein
VSVLVWGWIPQGIGLVFALLVHPLDRQAPNLAGILMFSTAPIYLLALLCALGRMIRLRMSRPEDEIRRGARLGALVFSGLWLLASTLGCGWIWMNLRF